MGPSGAHLAATLYDLAQAAQRDHPGGERDIYARVANRLSELVENVRGIAVDVDDKRQLLSIVMTDLRNTEHVASALSDGTLRFLALTVMESDPRSRRLLCLEEPENGIVCCCWRADLLRGRRRLHGLRRRRCRTGRGTSPGIDEPGNLAAVGDERHERTGRGARAAGTQPWPEPMNTAAPLPAAVDGREAPCARFLSVDLLGPCVFPSSSSSGGHRP